MSLDTCSRTSLEDFDHAVLKEEEIQRILAWREEHCGDGDYLIILMHHQPEVLRNPELLDRLQGKADLMLIGHLHSDHTRGFCFRGICQVNGMAVTPHQPEIPMGIQIVCMDRGNTTEIIRRRLTSGT